ncbi:hypothetical protein VI06_19280 [Aquitalea magnusonii]|nr:hypothetical protein VI06_19280 [Aquitalea magnusonii]
MMTDSVAYQGRRIRVFAIHHAGENKWEGWSGISFTSSDHFIASYSGLMDLRENKEDALTVALHAAMAWIDAIEMGVLPPYTPTSGGQQIAV